MKFVEIQFGTALYEQELQLRDLFLRRPWGLLLNGDDVKDEESQYHYGMVRDNVLVACVVVMPLTTGNARLRQMVVLPDFRKTGVGSRLLAEVERDMVAKGMTLATLHARLPVVPFYEKSGYVPQGQPFTEVGMLHQRMVKDLARQ